MPGAAIHVWHAMDGLDLVGQVIVHLFCPMPAISSLWVGIDKRGNGIGAQLVELVIEQYGEAALLLVAKPFDWGGLSAEELVVFYERFGFRLTGTADDVMVRPEGAMVI